MSDVTRQKLTEATFVNMNLLEARASSGRLVAEGEFGRVDVPTQNGRIYPRKLMEREIKRLGSELKERGVTGELDHPSDGKNSLQRISHVITSLRIEDDGRVMGRCEILETPNGKILKAIIDGKVKVGVSSRGYGSTAPASGQHEGEEVQEDFVLKTYDFVADPAMKTAIPEIRTEDVDDDQTVAEMFMAEFPEIAQALTEGQSVSCELTEGKDGKAKQTKKEIEETVRAELAENFERQLKDAMVALREEVAEEIREEYSADPEMAGAKGMLAAIAEMVGAYAQTPDEKAVQDAIKVKDLEVAEAKKERDEAAKLGQVAAHQLVIEKKIGKHPMADSIRKLLSGKVFENSAAAEEAVDAVIKELPDADEVVTKEEAAAREENAELKGKLALLESKVGELKDKVAKVHKLNERIDEQRIDEVEKAKALVEEAALKATESEERAAQASTDAKVENVELKASLQESEMRVYKLEKVVGLPNGRELIGLMESVQDKAVVDKLVDSRRAVEIGDPNLRAVRERVEAQKKGATSDAHQLEESVPTSPSPMLEEFGTDMEHMKTLAGFTPDGG